MVVESCSKKCGEKTCYVTGHLLSNKLSFSSETPWTTRLPNINVHVAITFFPQRY